MKLIADGRKYTDIPAPCLFIFANPHGLGTWVDSNTDVSVTSSARTYNDARKNRKRPWNRAWTPREW